MYLRKAMSSNFAIYLTEKKCGGGEHDISWYHAGLILVDVDAGNVVQQIHFSNTHASLKMQPQVFNDQRGMGNIRKDFNPKEMLAGDEASILAAWNHMLKYAVFIHKNTVMYDEDFIDLGEPKTINCRAGVIAALETIGIIIKPDDCKEVLGTKARDRLPLGVLFLRSASPHQSLEELRHEHKRLSTVLNTQSSSSSLAYDLGPGWHV